MSLRQYHSKRRFDATPEPQGSKVESDHELRFVVQLHHASHVHYDFRLEVDGVLKSWAVPKGPSMNPDDKRLAMMVEDHPYDYKDFEGVIPEGNYGAGKVIIWDEGTYVPLDSTYMNVEDYNKAMKKGLKEGSLKFTLNGHKLKGSFALVRMKTDTTGKSWLLIKHDDKYKRTSNIGLKSKSVVSGKTIDQIDSVKEKTSKVAKRASKKTRSATTLTAQELIEKYKPMLAKTSSNIFDDEEWIYEIKWDGYRAIASVINHTTYIASRSGKNFTEIYETVARELANVDHDIVVDGELVVMDEHGVSKFQLLQTASTTKSKSVVYEVFDLLWLNGIDCTSLPLIERKHLLKEVLPISNHIQYSDHIVGQGVKLFEKTVERGIEGVIAKKSSSIYTVGRRSSDWLKIKSGTRQEAVIAGYTKPRGSREYLGSIILGVYDQRELVYAGHTGTGFSNVILRQLYATLKDLKSDRCPFNKVPRTNAPVTWVEPKLVAEIKFTEWTADGVMRQPVFVGLREDKEVKRVVRENNEVLFTDTQVKKRSETKRVSDKVGSSKSMVSDKHSGLVSTVSDKVSSSKSVVSDKVGSSKSVVSDIVVTVDKQSVKITNYRKLYWKKERITKGDMIEYYHAMASYILPYLKNRPQSLHRFPDGADNVGFYQKDLTGKKPDWIMTHIEVSDSTNQEVEYMVCTNEASLLYMANLGCIEMNPWHSRTNSRGRVDNLDKPDYCIIDLDPHEISFDKVIDTANVVRSILNSMKINSYCKTSGATGLHVYIPLHARYTYEQSRMFARIIAELVHKELPGTTSIERLPSRRRRKVYLDYLQNGRSKTIVAPYSLRPVKSACVSTPLDWSEVKAGLVSSDFNINTIRARLEEVGDLFKPVLGGGVDLRRILLNA